MVNREIFGMAWEMLDKRERRNAFLVLAVVILSAVLSAAMVGSIAPFLSVLADPESIQKIAPLQWVYQKGSFQSSHDFLIVLGLCSIALVVIANTFQVLRVYAVSRFVFMRSHSISHKLLKSYLSRPYSYFLVNHSGEMGTKLLAESQQVVQQFFRPAAEACAAVLTTAALLFVMLYANFVVSLSVFAGLGGIYGISILISRRKVRRMGVDRAKANTERYRIANEGLGGIRDIKILGRERFYLNRYTAPSQKMAQTQAGVAVISQVPQYVMHGAAFSGLILACLVILGDPASVNREVMATVLPTIGLLVFAGQRMIPELSKLFQSLTMLAYGAAAVKKVHADLIGFKSTEKLPANRPQPTGLKSSLALNHVSFFYESNGKPGLSDISLQINAGERIGIVGTTGAGKSTLANILLGLILPTNGEMVVDGNPVKADKLRAWQATVGYVPQEIFLVDASIRENIALGVLRNQIDENRMLEAAKIAQIHDFVTTELAQGYDTEVGERGIRLSGGQRQRIGIARALYNDADLIVFDEATSALDNVTENEVMRSIDELPWDKTLIVIAHRLSTLRNCNRILVLDKGKVAGFASWDELQKENFVFRDLTETH